MKDIIFRFKTEEDYLMFLRDIRDDNARSNFMTEEELDNNIIMNFKEFDEQGGGGTI